jgi:hypothetical protein
MGAFLLTMVGCVRSRPKEADLVLAIVGEKRIRASDFRRELDRLDPSLRSKYVRERGAFLDRIVEEEVIYRQAVKKELAQTPEARKRLARAEADAAIKRLKEQEIYSRIAVKEEEIKERYQKEIATPEEARIIKSILYVLSPPGGDTRELVEMIGNGIEQGLSFPEIARRNSLPYETMEFDSPRFGELPPQIQSLAKRMTNKAGVAVNLGETPFYFFKDARPLSSCFREIGRAIRDEKGEKALRERLSLLRAKSAITLHEEVLKDKTKKDAVAAEVNGFPVTVDDVVSYQRGFPEKDETPLDQKSALDAAIDTEILRQEAMNRNLHNDAAVKEEVAREARRIVVELLTEQNVTALTPAAREKQRAEWVEGLTNAAGVTPFPENLNRMQIPPSKEIQDVFGGRTV